jgi:hypothetical protein
MEMNIGVHDRGSERSHNQRKEDAKGIGIKMSKEEFDREFTEVKERLGIIMELL